MESALEWGKMVEKQKMPGDKGPIASAGRGRWFSHSVQTLMLWLYVSLMAIAVIGSHPERGVVLIVLGGVALGLYAVKPLLQTPPE